MALTNAPKSSYVTENWLFDFTADNSNCLEFFPESSAGSNNGSFVSFGNILAVYTDFTIEFWINPDDVTSVDFPIISRTGGTEDADDNDSFLIKLLNDEIFIQYEFGSGSNVTFTSASANIAADTWTHVAVVRSDTDDNIKLYLNGTLNETFSSSDTDENPTGSDSSDVSVFVGANFAKTKFYDGELAHVRVWNVARTASQISRFYDRLVDSTASGLQGYWKLDEGGGTIAYDSSSNSNNGTLSTNHSDGSTNMPTYTINGFTEYIHAFGLSFYDTDVDGHKYHGSVLNSITLRDSIDITKGTSNTSNFSLTSANFTIEGADLYKQLFNSTNNYLNKTVRVYSQFNDTTSLSSCQRIFTGKLVDIKLDHNQNITMQINSHRPWDKITFPQDQDPNSNIYVPTVYGAYTPNDSTVQTPAECGFELYPIPVIDVNDSSIVTVMPRSYSGDNKSHINYHLDNLKFLPAAHQSNYGVVDDTIVRGGNNVLVTPIEDYHYVGIVPATENEPATTNTLFTDAFKAFDRDDTTSATATFASTSSTVTIGFSASTAPFYASLAQKITVKFQYSINGNVDLTLGSDAFLSSFQDLNISCTADTTVTRTANITVNIGSIFSTSNFTISFQPSSGESSVGTVKILSITAQVKFFLFGKSGTNTAEDRADSNALGRVKFYYSGGAGLTESWTGGNTPIAWGIEAFRDLMIRFAGHGRTAPTGYTQLYYDRRTSQGGTDQDTWKIRYWQLKPANLKKKLDQIAYEFGFVYKFAADGTLKLIHILQSSELSATLNLTADDLDKVQVSTTGLGSVITKMTINNILNPADSSQYVNSITNTNTTTRNKYNLGDKEGIQNINLDMNVGDIPTSANSDCNADFYSYYNNIIGDIKILVSCDIVNMAKGYQLETGDIVTFTDMPVEMFGTDFSTSKYFMIIETKRSLGKVSVVAREVG